MIRYIIAACGISAALFSGSAVAQPITWAFVITSCADTSNPGAPCPMRGSATTFPLTVGSLTIDSGDTGSASYIGGQRAATPILRGGPFRLAIARALIDQTFSGISAGLYSPVEFTITWSNGAPERVYLSTRSDEVNLGPTGGLVGTSDELAGCVLSLCRVTGFWQQLP